MHVLDTQVPLNLLKDSRCMRNALDWQSGKWQAPDLMGPARQELLRDGKKRNVCF